MSKVCPICGEEKTDWDAEYIKENGTCIDCDQ